MFIFSGVHFLLRTHRGAMGKEKRLLPIKEAFQLAGAAASPEPGEAGGGENFTKKKRLLYFQLSSAKL